MTPFTAYAMMTAALVLGGGSLLLFAAFVILGPFAVVGLHLSKTSALLWDAALSGLFFVQHSGMIRASFRARLARLIPQYYGASVFAIASGIALLAAVLLWQPVPTMLLRLQGTPRVLARLLSLLAILGTGWGAHALRTFDTFGLAPVRAHLQGQAVPPAHFVVRGPYLWVRHPLYFCMLLFIWSAPDVTLDRLLFNGLWTAWIFLGASLEEKDLVAEFGARYRRYQSEVPMLLPWRRPVRSHR